MSISLVRRCCLPRRSGGCMRSLLLLRPPQRAASSRALHTRLVVPSRPAEAGEKLAWARGLRERMMSVSSVRRPSSSWSTLFSST